MPAKPESADITDAVRAHCRNAIETAGFHAVELEQEGAGWERTLPGGDRLVVAARGSMLFGQPERREWTIARFLRDGTFAGFAGPMTLIDVLGRAAELILSGCAGGED